jgi:transposase InsO family protein
MSFFISFDQCRFEVYFVKDKYCYSCLFSGAIGFLNLLPAFHNGPAFMVEIVQGLAKIVKIKWKLRTAYRPQSSGKVECMNQTLKTTLANSAKKHSPPGPAQACSGPASPRPSSYSPFEILYGRPPPTINRLRGDLRKIRNLDMSRHLQALRKTPCHSSWEVLVRTPIPMGNWVHPHQPGDIIWVKDWKKRTTPTQLDRSPSSSVNNSHGF